MQHRSQQPTLSSAAPKYWSCYLATETLNNKYDGNSHNDNRLDNDFGNRIGSVSQAFLQVVHVSHAILQVALLSVGKLQTFLLRFGLALVVRVGNNVTNGNAKKHKSDSQTVDECRLRTALSIDGATKTLKGSKFYYPTINLVFVKHYYFLESSGKWLTVSSFLLILQRIEPISTKTY